MADEDVMALDPQSSSSSLPPQGSSDHSATRRDSVEDADPTLTRKRQRLEMPLETDARRDDAVLAPSSPPSSPPTAQTHPTPDSVRDPSPPPQSPSQMTRLGRPGLARTPSKVTINVRGPRPPTAGEMAQPSPVSERGREEPASSSATGGPAEPSASTTEDTSGPFSPASSSARSPEVEIAEVEEMDQDYAVTEWDPLGGGVLETEAPAALMEKFPFYIKGCEMRELVAHLARTMEKGGSVAALGRGSSHHRPSPLTRPI